MRLLGAELLKIRRRTATYVVLVVMLVLTVLLTAVLASEPMLVEALLQFPTAWMVAGDFPFGALGTLMAVSYAAAIAGADWNWGVLRNVIARGESRVLYVLAKAVALAIVLAIGVLIILLAGALTAFAITSLSNVASGDPLSAGSLEVLARQLLFGYPVLLERAALGFAVAIVLRSQVAGVVVGIVLYVGETLLTTLLTVGTMAGSLNEILGGTRPPAQWFQYLPFSVGDQVRSAGMIGAPVAELPMGGGDFSALLLGQVPLHEALAVLALYLVIALGLSLWRAWREEIVA